jgi:hypothetical protein
MEFHHQHTTPRHKYSITLLKEAYLLRCGLRDLKLLGHALVGHVARPPWRRGQTILQASWRILNERNMRQSRAAESRPQLEALLQRLLIIFLRSVFNDYGAVPFTDYRCFRPATYYGEYPK